MSSDPRTPFAADCLTLEIVPDLLHEIGWQAWFGDKSLTSRGAGTRSFRRQGVGAERDDHEMTRVWRRLEQSSRLPTVNARQRQVHQNQIWLQPPRLLDSLTAVAGCLGPKAAELQVVTIHFARIVEVFDHENQWLACGIPHAGDALGGWGARGLRWHS